jgi:ankyrin repeat protein
MRLLPTVVVEQIIDTLKLAANNDTDSLRRGTASFELAFALINNLDQRIGNYSELALSMLHQAANLGFKLARGMVSWFYAAYGLKSPVHPLKDFQWLLNATATGDTTARRQLLNVNEHLHTKAMYDLRHKYCGVGVELYPHPFESPDALVEEMKIVLRYGLKIPDHILHCAAACGHLDLAVLIMEEATWGVNKVNRHGETPVHLACRSGHYDLLQYLVSKGADVTISSNDGLTPLHWLSSFPDDTIDQAADLLISKKANIEARSAARENFGDFRRWNRPGCEDGTPLLWAVVSFNLPATRALIRHSADPWDQAGSALATSNKWGGMCHYSPVHYASAYHMTEVLEVLLQEVSNTADQDQNPLNCNYRQFGSGVSTTWLLPLMMAVSDGLPGHFLRMLLHGNLCEESAIKTITLLLSKGANPFKVDRSGTTAVEAACYPGTKYLLNTLYEWKERSLRPQLAMVKELLWKSIYDQDRTTFNFLLHAHSSEVSCDPELLGFLRDAAAIFTKDPYFIQSLPSKSLEESPEECSRLIELAVIHGNFKLAYALHQHIPFDPTYTWKGSTTLGRLIRQSKLSVLVEQAVEFLLSLIDPDAEDDKNGFGAVYDTDQLRSDTPHSLPEPEAVPQMSLLHVAAMQVEFKPGQTDSFSVLNAVLSKYNSPEQLNAPMAMTNWTPLHTAVFCGNISAVKILLNEADVNIGALDEANRTPMDLAWLRLRNPDESLNFWDVLPEDQPAGRDTQWENTAEILRLLYQKDAPHRKFSGLMRRETEDRAMVMFFGSIGNPNTIIPIGLGSGE